MTDTYLTAATLAREDVFDISYHVGINAIHVNTLKSDHFLCIYVAFLVH